MKIKKIVFVLVTIVLFLSFLFLTKGEAGLFSGNYFLIPVFILSLVLIARFTGNNKRVTIFLAANVAIVCVSLFVLNNFQMKYGTDFLLPTVFTSLGTGFLVLWQDNSRIFQFLLFGLVLLLLGLNFATTLNGTWISDWFGYITKTVSNAWPWFLLIIGVGSIVKARNIKKITTQVPQ
ncbi:MAG: hypothetical protein SCALA702_13150 [Melioribacteraceae bacterium]|nr:MAG: hypothetical protein SCALA702_13150 [Melioribacteraceae bacterium]